MIFLETPELPHFISEHNLRKFWNLIDLNGPIPPLHPTMTPCWLWRGNTNVPARSVRESRKKIYGRLYFDSDYIYVHRLMYALTFGPIPVGYQVDHLCHVELCVNPGHLEAKDQSANMQNTVAKAILALKEVA